MQPGFLRAMALVLCACGALLLANAAPAQEHHSAPIPVGLDAYRFWDHWADQRIGMRTFMRNIYDSRGGNEGADLNHGRGAVVMQRVGFLMFNLKSQIVTSNVHNNTDARSRDRPSPGQCVS